MPFSPGQPIPHPKSTRFDEDGEEERARSDGDGTLAAATATITDFPPAKRLKISSPITTTTASKRSSPKGEYTKATATSLYDQHQHHRSVIKKEEISDSDAETADEHYADDDEKEEEQQIRPRRTDLEAALPPIQTDQEAIEAYEASQKAREGDTAARFGDKQWQRGKSSIYVDAFNLALETVLEEESHLFDEAEHLIFDHWRTKLPYEAQYLYVRLFLRKTSSWHRINKLGYHSDVADLPQAIAQLQDVRDLPAPSSQTEQHPGEFEIVEDTMLGSTFTFADQSEEGVQTLEQASSLLLLDELKAFAKDARVQGKNKKELLAAFRKTSGKQKGLGFSLRRSDTEETTMTDASGNLADDSGRETTPGKAENRDSYWVGKIMAETGPCIRLSLSVLRLFERVHLVFYRSTEWTEKSLTTIILAGIARRNFPEYIVSRSANIFPSRSLLVEFEAAVRTQFRVDSILEFNGTPTTEGLRNVLEIFEQVYPRWQVLLAEEQRKEDSIYSTGEGAYLRRLSPAWVYTRIVHKGAYVLGKFKHHQREHEILSELLRQKLFHISRRGDWYQRKALLEEHYIHLHLPSPPEYTNIDAKKKFWKRIALQTCETGLEDQLTHLIFHRDLQKRTTKLEKALKVAKRQQHDFAHVRLATPAERTFTGIRLERSRPPLGGGSNGRRSSDQSLKGASRGAKTIWLDPEAPSTPDDLTSGSDGRRADSQGHCSVEEMCLSCYRAQGWKGYHSEGGILRTLFAYLFYDVLFVYIPNVFQTPFQTCPLDLHTDAFYPSRLSEVHARLNEISNGEAPRLIQQVWDTHYERRTCVVGLDWAFALDDLLEIARCFAPAALSTVMKVLVQEYGQRGGGVPDLFLWRLSETAHRATVAAAVGTAAATTPGKEEEAAAAATRSKTTILTLPRQGGEHAIVAANEASSDDQQPPRNSGPDQHFQQQQLENNYYCQDPSDGEVMFAEVKSENDRLSDTQRMWIDVLSGAGVKVELCHAVASEVRVL